MKLRTDATPNEYGEYPVVIMYCTMGKAVRTTIILPQKDLRNIIVDSEKMSIFVRVKNQTPDKYSGYSGLLTNIRTKNGIQGEIQFNTAKMIYAKEKPKDAKFLLGLRHGMLSKGDRNAGRFGTNITKNGDHSILLFLLKRQEERFWRNYQRIL